MDVTTAKAWESLSKFENYDYVWNLIQSFTPKTENFPNNEKLNHTTRDINAHFTQGREYFRNAEQAALITKPLLLYYGVLALARGSILLLNADNANFTRAFGHGLSLKETNSIQDKNHMFNLLDIGIQPTKKTGTFKEFVEYIGNCNNFFIRINPELIEGGFFQLVTKKSKGLNFTIDLPKTNFLTKDNCLITLDDLLSRDSRLYLIYNATLDNEQNRKDNEQNRNSKYLFTNLNISRKDNKNYLLDCHFYQSFTDNRTFRYKMITYLGKLCSKPTNEDFVTSCFDFQIPLGNEHFEKIITNHNFDDKISSLPAIQVLNNYCPMGRNLYKQEYKQYAILNFNDGDSFSLLHITYMTTYLLGMIARYYPYQWSSLLRGEKGNFGQPVILQAIQNIERDFPVLINSALEAKCSEKQEEKPSIVKLY